MSKEIKVDSEELLRVRSHGRSLYMKIPGELASAFGLKLGDILRVEIKSLIKSKEGQAERPQPGNATLSKKRCISKNEKEEEE